MVPRPPALPAKRLAGELKKHVGAVHMKSNLTLLQRKVSNVLLLNAYEELGDLGRPEHEIRLGTLAEAAGFDSNDHQLLRDALEALVDLKIRWNLLDEKGDEEWGVSAFLSQAVVSGGRCRYAYPPDLRRRLYNPDVFARINLNVQERFGSSYALALYENCVRYRRVGGTGWISLDQWRDLLGVGEGQYAQFKYLKRDVITPAVREVNAESDIRVRPEYRREKRRVVAIKFHVADAPQQRLPFDGVGGELASKGLPSPVELAPSAEALFPAVSRLRRFGLSERQAVDLVRNVDGDQIERNLAFVEAELKRGRSIHQVAAFTIQAIRDDYAGASPKESGESKSVAPADSDAMRPERRPVPLPAPPVDTRQDEAFEAAWAELEEETQVELERAAIARLRGNVPFVYELFRESGGRDRVAEGTSPVASTLLKTYLREALEVI